MSSSVLNQRLRELRDAGVVCGAQRGGGYSLSDEGARCWRADAAARLGRALARARVGGQRVAAAPARACSPAGP